MKILPNGIAVIEGDTHISRWVEQSGRLDHDQNALPAILARIRPGDTVIDVGAFIGDHTVAYAVKTGLAGMVHAFEPNPAAYECLLHNTKDRPNVHCHNYALGDMANHAAAMHYDANAGASHLAGAASLDDPVIDIVRLDEFLLCHVNFIKIDAEGYEPKVLAGAAQTIARCRPILYVEVNEGALNRQRSSGAALLRQIAGLGYAIEEPPHRGPQYDVFCPPLLKPPAAE